MMKLKEFLNVSDLIIKDVKFTTKEKQHILTMEEGMNIINNDKLHVIFEDTQEGEYPVIESCNLFIKPHEKTLDVLEITLIESNGNFMSDIVILIAKYFEECRYNIKYDKDRNVLINISGDINEEYVKILEGHKLENISLRVKKYLIDNNLYKNEILNHEYKNVLILKLPVIGYYDDKKPSDKLDKIIDDIKDISPLYIDDYDFNTTKKANGEEYVIVPFRYHGLEQLKCIEYKYIIYGELLVMNTLKKSKFNNVFMFDYYKYEDKTLISIPINTKCLEYEYPYENHNCGNLIYNEEKNEYTLNETLNEESKDIIREINKYITNYCSYIFNSNIIFNIKDKRHYFEILFNDKKFTELFIDEIFSK